MATNNTRKDKTMKTATTAKEVAQFLYEQRDNPDAGCVWGPTGNPHDDPEVRGWIAYFFHGLHYDKSGYLKLGEGQKIERYHRRGRLVISGGSTGEGGIFDPREIVHIDG